MFTKINAIIYLIADLFFVISPDRHLVDLKIHLRRHIMRSFLFTAAMAGALASGTANAAQISSFTGYTVFGNPCGSCDSVVNFSVYETTDSIWNDDPFFGGATDFHLTDLDGQFTATPDLDAKYVYLYQVINNNPGNNAENALSVFAVTMTPNKLSSVTSAGYFDSVFLDGAGIPNVVNNSPDFTLADPDPTLLNADAPDDHIPTSLGNVTNGLANGGPQAFAPTSVRTGTPIVNPLANGGAVSSGILFEWNNPENIPVGGTSTVVFFTSDEAPGYRWAETEYPSIDGAAGDVPAPAVPVPGSLALLLTGAVGSVAWSRLKARKGKQTEG